VRLELIDELKESFKKVLGEPEELDFEKMESDLREKFDDILVILKSLPHSFFRTQLLLTASLRECSAPSSVSLDIGQHCCPHWSFQNSLEVMQIGLTFI